MTDSTASVPAPRQRRIGRRWLVLALLLILPTLLAELGVQVLIATHRLAPAAGHTEAIESAWADLDRMGRVDILLTGASTVQAGLEPAVLGALAGGVLGRTVTVFNLGVPGTATDLAMLEQLDREGRLPKLVIMGVSGGGLMDQGGSAFLPSPMGQLFSRCSGPEVESYEQVVDCQAGLVSALWRWRGRLDSILEAIRRPLSGGKNGGMVRRADGFLSGRPRPLSLLEQQIPTGVERITKTVDVGPRNIARYRRIADFLRSRGVAVLGVSIPYAPTFMDAIEAVAPGYAAAWADSVVRLSDEAGIPFVDPGGFGPWAGDGSFQNIRHLSRDGAADFTRQLWDTPEFRDAVEATLRPAP